MISKEHRFHGHNSLNFVYKTGTSVRGEYVSLRFARSRKQDYRLAVVVSKKVSKIAVVRNRIRRRIYEVVRNMKKDSGTLWPYDLVISVFDERVATMSQKDLETALFKLINRAQIK